MATSSQTPAKPTMPPSPAAVDPRSGYCAATGTYHSLRLPVPLPPSERPISFPALAFSLLLSQLPSHPALIDSATGVAVPFPAFLSRVHALAAALRVRLRVSPGDVAFVLAPPGVHIPVLYYAVMAVGSIVSPANPALTAGEISTFVSLSNPSLAFAVQDTAAKLPPGLKTVLLDSPRFLSLLQEPSDDSDVVPWADVVIHQSDPAAILYSSGTTGLAKAVELTHRNIISSAAALGVVAAEVLLLSVPAFHVYGFVFCLRAVLAAQTLVMYTAKRFSARDLLTALARYRVARLALAPPTLLAIVQAAEDNPMIARTTTLQAANCGGASISPELARRFNLKFPHICLLQVGFAAASSN
jgi:4-coumarate--CoA ligase